MSAIKPSVYETKKPIASLVSPPGGICTLSGICPSCEEYTAITAKDVESDTKRPLPHSVEEPAKDVPMHTPASSLFSLGGGRGLTKSVFGFDKILNVRFSRAAVLTSSGGGVLQLVTSIIPSQFSQYTQYSTFFDAVRYRRVRLHVVPQFIGPTTSMTSAMAVGFDPYGIAAGSYTFDQVTRLAGSILINSNGTSSAAVRSPWFVLKNRQWSPIGASSATTDPESGVTGAFAWCLSGAGPVSQQMFTYIIELDLQVRNQF